MKTSCTKWTTVQVYTQSVSSSHAGIPRYRLFDSSLRPEHHLTHLHIHSGITPLHLLPSRQAQQLWWLDNSRDLFCGGLINLRLRDLCEMNYRGVEWASEREREREGGRVVNRHKLIPASIACRLVTVSRPKSCLGLTPRPRWSGFGIYSRPRQKAEAISSTQLILMGLYSFFFIKQT